jgi:site-specific DNA-methyltransferase (adenine-specific)
MGIGTTALACIKLGVNYMGTEIDADYIKVALEDVEKRKKEMATDSWSPEDNNDILVVDKKIPKEG